MSLFEVVEFMGDDTTVVNAARVSMGKRVAEMGDRDVGLIRYLAEHKHISPFYHPKMSARVSLPLFIWRQWAKHRVGVAYTDEFDHNEISGRYVDFGRREYWQPSQWRKAAPNVKQGSGEGVDPEMALIADKVYTRAVSVAFDAYEAMLESGICKEQARAVLPLATFTEFVTTGSLYAWFNFWRQRADGHAQAEIRVYADMVDAAMRERFPHSWQALKDYA